MMALAYREAGDRNGYPVVLLHPIGTGREVWQPILHTLSDFRLLLMDLPGHGGSPCGDENPCIAGFARDVAQTLDVAGISRAVIVGISLGAMVAQALALDMPSKVHGLVLAHTASTTTVAVRQIWSDRRADLREHGADATVSSTIERWFPNEFRKDSPLTMTWLAGLLSTTPANGWDSAMEAISHLDLFGRLGEISAPTLVIRGTHDQTTPPEVAQNMAAAIPGARYVEIDSGHVGCVEQPIAFAEVVGGFCRSLSMGQGCRG